MKFVALALLSFGINFKSISSLSDKLTPLNLEIGYKPESLTFIGSVDGKAFFADNTTMNYWEAKRFCQDMKMKLATITSETQAVFLKDAYHPDHFYGVFWVAGQERIPPIIENYLWDDGSLRDQLNSTYLWIAGLEASIHPTCLCLHITGGNDVGRLNFGDCIEAKVQVLCEIKD